MSVVVVLVLVGTLTPASLKIAAESQLPHMVPWSAMAHFFLFALLAWVAARRETPVCRVSATLLLTAALAGGTEWLQQWVPGRHPSCWMWRSI